jgi:hypothetical protein
MPELGTTHPGVYASVRSLPIERVDTPAAACTQQSVAMLATWRTKFDEGNLHPTEWMSACKMPVISQLSAAIEVDEVNVPALTVTCLCWWLQVGQRRHCELSRNTCLAGRDDNDGVEARCAQSGWACEVRSVAVPWVRPQSSEQGSVQQRRNFGGSSARLG